VIDTFSNRKCIQTTTAANVFFNVFKESLSKTHFNNNYCHPILVPAVIYNDHIIIVIIFFFSFHHKPFYCYTATTLYKHKIRNYLLQTSRTRPINLNSKHIIIVYSHERLATTTIIHMCIGSTLYIIKLSAFPKANKI